MRGYTANTKVKILIPNDQIDRHNRDRFIEKLIPFEELKEGDYVKIVNLSKRIAKYVPAQIISEEYSGTMINLMRNEIMFSLDSEQKCLCGVFLDEKKRQVPFLEEKVFFEIGKKKFKEYEFEEDLIHISSWSRMSFNEDKSIDEYVECFNKSNHVGLGSSPIKDYKVVMENYKGKLYNLILPEDCVIENDYGFLMLGFHE